MTINNPLFARANIFSNTAKYPPTQDLQLVSAFAVGLISLLLYIISGNLRLVIHSFDY